VVYVGKQITYKETSVKKVMTSILHTKGSTINFRVLSCCQGNQVPT